jgi:hypothetical protein
VPAATEGSICSIQLQQALVQHCTIPFYKGLSNALRPSPVCRRALCVWLHTSQPPVQRPTRGFARISVRSSDLMSSRLFQTHLSIVASSGGIGRRGSPSGLPSSMSSRASFSTSVVSWPPLDSTRHCARSCCCTLARAREDRAREDSILAGFKADDQTPCKAAIHETAAAHECFGRSQARSNLIFNKVHFAFTSIASSCSTSQLVHRRSHELQHFCF